MTTSSADIPGQWRTACGQIREIADKHSVPLNVETWLLVRAAYCLGSTDGYLSGWEARGPSYDETIKAWRETQKGPYPPHGWGP